MKTVDCVTNEDEIVEGKVVPHSKRLSFLPRKLPKAYMHFERYVYQFASALIKEYDGGFWEFLELSNGGFYIRPSGYEKVTIFVPGNHFEGRVSADAAGVIVCMFALCYIAEDSEDNGVIELYFALKSFINDHPEMSLIRRAID